MHQTLHGLKKYGRIALIGGMIRDLALFGNLDFRSDIDFVIVPHDLSLFEGHMSAIGARTNRFGGYALPPGKWQIDIWPMERTWARLENHVSGWTVGDLRKITFFNCDAIVYDLTHKKMYTNPNYFDELDRKLLEINLLPNPNPEGNAVRAFRYALIKEFYWGPKLSRFVAEMIDKVGWDSLRRNEFNSFRTRYLDTLKLSDFQRQLERHVSTCNDDMFDPSAFKREIQLELPHLHRRRSALSAQGLRQRTWEVAL